MENKKFKNRRVRQALFCDSEDAAALRENRTAVSARGGGTKGQAIATTT